MKSGLRIFLVLAVVLSVVTLNFVQVKAADKIVVVYGPATFVRDNGKPVEKVVTFTLARPVGEYTMVVQNGDKGARVTSAVIKVNGKVVLGSSDFNENMESTKVVFPLEKNNELSVELKGKPGSKLIITISGVNELEAKDVAQLVMDATRNKDAATVREFAPNLEGGLYGSRIVVMDINDYCNFEFTLAAYQLELTTQNSFVADSSSATFTFTCSAIYEGYQFTKGAISLIKTAGGWKVSSLYYE